MELFKLWGRIMIDSNDANTSIAKTESGFDKLGKKLDRVGQGMTNAGRKLTAGVTVPILGIGAAMLKSAADLEATEAKYSTVFAGMTDDADEFIKEFQKLTPATTAEARNMASGIQDLLVPMGFMREEATAITGELFHVIGALTNFNSATHTAEQVTNAVQSALLGRYTALAGLGIQLDVTTVKEKAVAMGLAETTAEVTKQHQVLVLLEEIYAQSGDALEAYTEENLDAKTKMALLRKEAIDVAAEFGRHMLPMLEDLVAILRDVVDWFGNLDEEQQKKIITIGAVVAAGGPLLIFLGNLLKAITFLLKPIKLVTTALIGKKAAMAGAGAAAAGAKVSMVSFGAVLATGGPILLGLAAVAGAVYVLRKEYNALDEEAKRVADESRRGSWTISPQSIREDIDSGKYDDMRGPQAEERPLTNAEIMELDRKLTNQHNIESQRLNQDITSTQRHEHTGSITIKGVNDKDQTVAVAEIVLDELRREVRFA